MRNTSTCREKDSASNGVFLPLEQWLSVEGEDFPEWDEHQQKTPNTPPDSQANSADDDVCSSLAPLFTMLHMTIVSMATSF